jgi:hypothetical protein
MPGEHSGTNMIGQQEVDPEWLDLARANLERWARQNSNAPSLLRCYDEWRKLLTRPVAEVCAALIAEPDEGQRIRQNSPFAGVLTPREVWEIPGGWATPCFPRTHPELDASRKVK